MDENNFGTGSENTNPAGSSTPASNEWEPVGSTQPINNEWQPANNAPYEAPVDNFNNPMDTPYNATATSAANNTPKSGSKALEICALVFGILGIVCCVCYGLFGVIGLILSIICLATGKKSGLSITGLICSILGIILTIVMFAIGLNADTITEKLNGVTTETTEIEIYTEDETTEVDTEDETTEVDTEEETTEAAVAPAPVDGLSDTYADLDNRSFAVNGKVYTLGVTTLQEMIDDGVPFDSNDIANANNNLNANSSSSGFRIVLGEYYDAQVYVGNFTDENKTAAECPICEIYLPVDLDQPNDILQFAFPLTITEDELVANSGEPTDKSEYTSDDGDYQSNTYEYKKDSDKYIGDSGYQFEFVNGELRYLYIDLQ